MCVRPTLLNDHDSIAKYEHHQQRLPAQILMCQKRPKKHCPPPAPSKQLCHIVQNRVFTLFYTSHNSHHDLFIYRKSQYSWVPLTDGRPPFFPAAWPAQLCHQGSNSLLPRQEAHRLSKCLGPPLGIFTRPLWP